MEKLVERFFKYISFNTQSDEQSKTTPSTQGQIELAKYLQKELKEIGLKDVFLDKNGYLMASLPANTDKKVPTIGFIAHLDTSPDFSGENVQAQIINKYHGKDIILNQEKNIILSPSEFPELQNYVGEDLIVTDGNSLLGADNKAGIAEIVTAMEYLIKNPEIEHGNIKIAFTPDEEIGLGAAKFDVEKFDADWAYTIDGGEIGEIQYENFHAASALINIKGRNIHPGYAKDKLVNSIYIANKLISYLPINERPEHTEEREGFYHLYAFEGDVEKSSLSLIIRDFKKDNLENKKEQIKKWIENINLEFGKNTAEVEIKDQYANMLEKISPKMHIVSLVQEAMEEIGIKVLKSPIRGGTDGAQLSFKGLACPNIFAGGHNFHGKYEYIPIQSMKKAVELIVKIANKNVDYKYK